MTVKQLRTTLFPRFGEPLQIMFSLPQYGAHVLLKSFEIFHNEVCIALALCFKKLSLSS